MKINTTNQIATELNPITHSRVSHDCELLNKSVALVSGGLTQKGASEVLPDEVYNITGSGEVIKVLDLKHSLGRIQHSMIKIEDRIWALGGKDSNNTAPSKIAEFNPTSSSWNELAQELQSTNTTEVIVTPYPVASLDCVPECYCGNATRRQRIFGGSEAEVKITSSLWRPQTIFQVDSYPWIAALLRDEDIEADYINSKCGSVLVSASPINASSILSDLLVDHHYQTDRQQICPDSGSLPVRRRQRGVAARQLLLHHAWPPRQEEDQGAKQVTLTP